MKRFMALLIVLVLMMASFTACGEKKAREIDIQALSQRLLNEITYEDELYEMEDYLFDYLYGDITPADVQSKVIYVSSGATAEEIACFEAVDEEAAKRIESGVNSRVSDQTKSFTDYVPAEVKRLEDAVVVREGKYVILSVSGDSAKAKKIINE